MELKTYRNLQDKDKFWTFCKEQIQLDQSNASLNLWHDDWEKHNHTLPFILNKTDRFNGINGEFFVLFDKDEIAACSGIYISDFNNYVAIAGVRTWVNLKYRHQSLNKDYLLVEQKKWAIKNSMKVIALTFNEYNKNIIKIFKRTRLGETVDRVKNRKPENLFYHGVEEVPFQVIIKHTPQWVIYEKLDKNFVVNWELIKL